MACVYKEFQKQNKTKKLVQEKIIQLNVNFLLGYNMKAVI